MKQNHFFSSPKRRTLAIAVAAVVVVGGITAGAALSLRHEPGVFPGQVNDGNVPASAAGETLSQDSALQIALEHAGIGASDAVVTKNHLDFDDGIYEYEIEFFANGKEYDYTIHAQTGEIRSYDIEQAPQQSTPAPADTISADAALQIALEHSGLRQEDITLAKNKLDTDDGIYEYELEFYANGKEYDYTIHAQTGEIRSYEISTLQPGTGSTPDQGYLSQDAAYETALSDAGISADQAVLLKAELDLDDGVMEYEVEFFSNGIEYEYTLDATTGAILSKHQERAD